MFLRQVQVGGLVLVVLDDELADVPQDHRQLVGFVLLVQGEAEHRQAVDGELRAVAVEEIAHRVVLDVGVDEHHVDERVEVVGVVLVRLVLVDDVAVVVDVLERGEVARPDSA